MSDKTLELPEHTIQLVPTDAIGADGPVYLATVNGENGLETEVVDVRASAHAAFPPRAPERRTVTDPNVLVSKCLDIAKDKGIPLLCWPTPVMPTIPAR